MLETDVKGPVPEAALDAAGLRTDLGSPEKNAVNPDAADLCVPEPANPKADPSREASLQCKAADAAMPGAAPTSEIELKLLVGDAHWPDFENAPIIVASSRSKGTRKRLKSVYYDTPERTLWSNGLSLRVRQSGSKFVQTVKAELGVDPLRRGEWEAIVPSLAPDVALAMPFIPSKLRAAVEGQPLEPVFVADIRRHQRLVGFPSGSIEVAYDKGVLKSGDRSVRISEIELELKSGSVAAVYELALRLAEIGPLRPSIRSKAARGFDLAADMPPIVWKPRKPGLDSSMSLDDAFSAILRSCFHHLLQSLPAAEDGRDPEGVHQVRVALRRLRSALDLMRTVDSSSTIESLRSDAKWLAQSVSAARDFDIFHRVTLPAVAEGCPAIAGFDSLAVVAEERRLAAYREAHSALTDRRSARFVINLGGWIEARGWRNDVAPETLGMLAEPAGNLVRSTMSDQFGKVLKRGRHFKSLTAEGRHRLRLAAKKLRYIADFFLPLCGDRKSVRKFADQLADLQEELGSYNDMATTASVLARIGKDSADGASAGAAIAGWQAHAMFGAETRLRKAWQDFKNVTPPWMKEASTGG